MESSDKNLKDNFLIDIQQAGNPSLSTTLLIVEKNSSRREEIAEIIKNSVEKVYSADNINSGLELFNKFKPDIVIIDITILNTEGQNFAEKIKLSDWKAKILALTSRKDKSYFTKSIDLGIDSYLLKPIKSDKLIKEIGKYCELKFLENKIKENDEQIRRLSRFIDQNPSALLITDLKGRIEYVNSKFTRLTGYKLLEAIGSSPGILNSGETPVETYNDMWNTINKGKEWHGEFLNRKKNGDAYWELCSISPIKDNNGEITNFIAVKEDTTEKKKSDEALLLSETMLRWRNDLIELDLKNAQLIQKALLPKEIPNLKNLEIDYRYLPLESVGGDYFSFTTLREGGMGVFLGDVTGHGVSAALFLALVKAFTDRACRDFGRNPKEYFRTLNLDLLNNMTTNFLTAIYGYFNFSKNPGVTFTLSVGGHPQPIVYRAESKTIEIVDARGTILGIMEKIQYSEKTIILNKGDRMFLYTDGLQETMNSGRDIFGIESLSQLILESNRETLSATLDSILQGIENYRGDAPATDDIVLIGFEVKQDTEPIPIG